MTSVQPVPRPGVKRTGIALILLGVIVGAICVVGFFSVIAREVVPDVTMSTWTTPVDASMTLKPATYVVYEERRTGQEPLVPSDAKITSPSGADVAIGTANVNQTLDRNGITFVARLSFVAGESGRYRIRVSAEKSTTVLVGHDLEQVGLHVIGWVGGGFLAGASLLAGIVVLVVRNSRNKAELRTSLGGVPPWQVPGQAQQPWAQQPWAQQPGPQQQPWAQQPPAQQPPAQLPPPGWYADPAEPGSGKLRWWDGQGWSQ